ncbi:hypothetical protein I317_03280 [Kwoniella heveanensis CBS 569]|nr:hypothetical protein I317_03280 [Kwoniella heveanensis CBS 569]
MSYYRPSATLVPTAPASAIASSSRLPPPMTTDAIDESPELTLADGPKGKRKEKSRVKMRIPVEDWEKWAGQMCNVRPLGACQRPQTAGSLYCTNHACQAVNADGERCGNWVGNPRESRFCATGWHMENARHSHLSDLLAVRRAHEQMASDDRRHLHAAQLYFIEQHFPSSASSTSTSSSSGSGGGTGTSALFSPVSGGAVAGASGARRSGNGAGQEERAWGAHGVDKWWVGQWGRERI